ncbi:MAG: beta-lactamase family protein [Betaproteobacteria bacterium]|nr:beta-lactamase family protein [Betaproteobacteria bacterium]
MPPIPHSFNSTLRHVAGTVLIILAAFPLCVRAAPPSFAESAELRDLPERWAPLLGEFLVPGVAVGVIKDGKVHAVATFGHRDAALSRPVTSETMFYIASVTKTYVASAFAVLAADGRIRLDDPVRKYLPRFTLPDAALAERVTLRQLLSHEPGISAFPIVLLDAYTGEIDDDRYYQWLAKAQVAGRVSYSNVHYTLLGRVLEAVTGKPWGAALDELVLKPAGLNRTTASASRLYADTDHASPLRVTPALAFEATPQRKTDATMHAAGGMGASISDALGYLAWHLGDGHLDGRPGGKPARRAELVREMRTQQAALEKPRGSIRVTTGFGLGWQVGSFGKHPFVAHSGGYPGAVAYYAMLPSKRAGIVILMNAGQSAGALADVIAIDLLNRLSGESLAPELLTNYRQRMRPEVQKLKAEPMVRPDNRLTTAQLTAPVAALAGEYVNPLWGTLRLTADQDGLRLRLGQLPLNFTSAEAGVVKLADEPLSGQALTLVPGMEGGKARATLATREWGDAVFERR